MNAPKSHYLRAQLSDIADCLSAALHRLQRDPELDRCEAVGYRLEAVHRHVQQLAEAICAERGDGE